jgi:hypothetical protein
MLKYMEILEVISNNQQRILNQCEIDRYIKCSECIQNGVKCMYDYNNEECEKKGEM